MKKVSFIGILSILLNVIFLADAFYFNYVINPFGVHTHHQHTEHCGHAPAKKAFRIAIFTPITHPALEEIQQGFVDTLGQEKGHAYEYVTYNAQGDRTLMRTQAEDITSGSFDLIFTIGTGPSKMAKETTSKKNICIPIVYAAVNEPVELELIASLESSDNNLTGVVEPHNIALQIDALKALKPNLKKVLLAYDPSQGRRLEKDAQEMTSYLEKYDIATKSAEIYHLNDINQKLPSLLDDENVDTLIILKDNTMVSGIESLVRICNRRHITLYASDLNSVDKGAALGFGVSEYQFGVQAALKARSILVDRHLPSTIPSTPVGEFNFKVNTRAMNDQGLSIPHLQLFFMQKTIIKK